MKTNEILQQMNEAIQYFINHNDNQPDTEFCKNVDKLINLKADLANDADTSNEPVLPIQSVVGSAFIEIPKPYIEDADTIEVDGGIYVVAGRVSKCYIPKEDLDDVIHIAN